MKTGSLVLLLLLTACGHRDKPEHLHARFFTLEPSNVWAGPAEICKHENL